LAAEKAGWYSDSPTVGPRRHGLLRPGGVAPGDVSPSAIAGENRKGPQSSYSHVFRESTRRPRDASSGWKHALRSMRKKPLSTSPPFPSRSTPSAAERPAAERREPRGSPLTSSTILKDRGGEGGDSHGGWGAFCAPHPPCIASPPPARLLPSTKGSPSRGSPSHGSGCKQGKGWGS
jgi:hypothetical protein